MRKKIDLRTLPGWLQCALVLLVVVIVVVVAWLAGRDQPQPAFNWIQDNLLLLGLFTLGVLAIVVGRWLGKRRDKNDIL